MYILIDQERMALLHKHNDMDVITSLGWIECMDAPYCIFDIEDASGFLAFTDMELEILYRNLTGEDCPKFPRLKLLQIIYGLCARVRESDVVPFEVECQAAYIKEGDGRRWLYAKGSTRPAQMQELFQPEGRGARRCKKEESRALAGESLVPKRKSSPTASGTGRDRSGTNTLTSPDTGEKVKRRTAKEIIWETADRVWKEAGEPADKATVLELRKSIMNILEVDEQIKKSSSSSQLGQWHKARAPF